MCNKVLEFLFLSLGSTKAWKNDVSFQSLVTWTLCIFQGILNKGYARMWLDSPCTCTCPIEFKKLRFAPRDKKDFFFKLHLCNLAQSYFLILLLFPLMEDVTLYFNIFESPLPKDTLSQWFLSRRFLKFANVFSLCGYYLCLEKYMSFHWTNWIPFTQEYFVSSVVEIRPAVLEKIYISCQYIFNLLLLFSFQIMLKVFYSKET